jgi:hypothetical protein
MCNKTRLSGLHRVVLTSIFFVFLHASSAGQNVGLSKPQDPADLPKSRTAVIHPKVLAKTEEETKLVRISDNEWIISGGWEQASASYRLIYLTDILPAAWRVKSHYSRMSCRQVTGSIENYRRGTKCAASG